MAICFLYVQQTLDWNDALRLHSWCLRKRRLITLSIENIPKLPRIFTFRYTNFLGLLHFTQHDWFIHNLDTKCLFHEAKFVTWIDTDLSDRDSRARFLAAIHPSNFNGSCFSHLLLFHLGLFKKCFSRALSRIDHICNCFGILSCLVFILQIYSRAFD